MQRIPRLDLGDAKEILEEFNAKDGIENIINIFKDEQGPDQEIPLLMIGIINVELLRGFLVAYMLFRNALINEEMRTFK